MRIQHTLLAFSLLTAACQDGPDAINASAEAGNERPEPPATAPRTTEQEEGAESMLIGKWVMVRAGDDEIGREYGANLTFFEDGTFMNEKGGGTTFASYQHNQTSGTIEILEGQRVVAEMAVQELTGERLTAKVGPELCVFEKVGAAVETARPGGTLPAPAEDPPFYQFGFASSGCAVKLSLNGFTFDDIPIDGDPSMSVPLNTLLVKGSNKLLIEVSARNPDAQLEASIHAARKGTMIEVGGPGQVSLPEGEAPQTLELAFESVIGPFETVLERSRELTSDEVLDFGLHLREVLKSRDVEAIDALFRPKLQLTSAGMGAPLERLLDHFAEARTTMFESDLAFERADLTAIPHCDGKVWELLRADGEACIQSQQGGEDGWLVTVKIFVADLGEGLRVVR